MQIVLNISSQTFFMQWAQQNLSIQSWCHLFLIEVLFKNLHFEVIRDRTDYKPPLAQSEISGSPCDDWGRRRLQATATTSGSIRPGLSHGVDYLDCYKMGAYSTLTLGYRIRPLLGHGWKTRRISVHVAHSKNLLAVEIVKSRLNNPLLR